MTQNARGIFAMIETPKRIPAEKSIKLPKSLNMPKLDFVNAIILRYANTFVGGFKLDKKTIVIAITTSTVPNILTSMFFKSLFYF